MKNLKEQNKISKILISWPFIIILFIIVVIFIINLFSFSRKMQESIKNKEIVEQRIVEINKNKEKLQNNIKKLQSDNGIEENIRENFGLIKEGEGVVVIVDNESEVELNEKRTFWTKIKDIFH